MANKMLIDAAHPEETRVVVLRGNRIEEFDFEAASRKQLRGNIYLAKVTRVEPSLQAAFIEYGGNRHGFLAFSEIHPDYYQIPVADRQALLEEEARAQSDEDEEPRSSQDRRRSRRHRRGESAAPAARRNTHRDEVVTDRSPVPDDGDTAEASAEPDEIEASDGLEPDSSFADPVVADGPDEAALEREVDSPDEPTLAAGQAIDVPLVEDILSVEKAGEDDAADVAGDIVGEHAADHEDEAAGDIVTTLEGGLEASHADGPVTDRDSSPEQGAEAGLEEEAVEQLGGDALEDVPQRVSRPRRHHYKIQEVIKRRQVLLVQVVKEERGNKGAALTTYLSLAGRYSVLMPNTARGGGISRKITDAEDRKRLKAIAEELEVPEGMGIILRTAGAARGMPEVKRDFEYLMRMWETVRETTLRSTAPTLVYEEGSLIKRSIRDLFNKDVDEVIVAGEEAYREAKDFMRLLMPSQAKAVVPYRESQPIFAKAGAEAQLDAMFSNQVTLRSGGYIVINQTEALVAIDVNSGRSTREHNIEDTALRTNLEAADEVARQLRLRDLAGLIVVDFIDMEEGRNDRAVERRLKDALKNDRARIQIGRISHFGLLEMSRQRMRTGVLEGSTVMCAHCAGTGTVRSMSSIALHVLRLIEDALIKSAEYNLMVRTRSEVALYILNQKRMNLLDLESRFGVTVTLLADVNMTGALYHAIDRGSEATPPVVFALRGQPAPIEDADAAEDDELVAEEAEEEVVDEAAAAPVMRDRAPDQRRDPAAEGEGGRRRKRRRRRRGGRDGYGDGPAREGQVASGESEGEDAGSDEPEELDQAELTDIAAGFAPVAAEAVAQHDVGATVEAASGEPDVSAASDTAAATAPGDGTDGTLAAAPEPSPAPEGGDAGQARSAEAVPDPADVPETDAPRRRRPRRTSRTADVETGSAEPAEAAAAPVKRARRTKARVAEPVASDDAPADRDGEADEAKLPEIAQPAIEPELPLVQEAPAPVVDVVDEPDRPKRSGWWQRAKATFTTGS